MKRTLARLLFLLAEEGVQFDDQLREHVGIAFFLDQVYEFFQAGVLSGVQHCGLVIRTTASLGPEESFGVARAFDGYV
jgi:hypothetical protein